MSRIYLDYNASTPIAPKVLEAMMPYLTSKFGNPSSSHSFGVECRAAIEQARERVANLLGCEASEIVFTSGATESNNMVIKGIAKAAGKGKHFITSQIEHPAVLEPCRHIERFGYKVTYLPVDKYGLVDPDALAKAITPDTALIYHHALEQRGRHDPGHRRLSRRSRLHGTFRSTPMPHRAWERFPAG